VQHFQPVESAQTQRDLTDQGSHGLHVWLRVVDHPLRQRAAEDELLGPVRHRIRRDPLRAAGLPRAEAVNTVEALGIRALRAYGKAGNKAWNRADAERSDRAIAHDFETLRLTDTRLAALFSEGNERMLRYFAKPVTRARLKVLQRSG